ncbi:MAG: hypothetical protein ACFFCQ_00415 [Promethearchaeota archaeon]
MPPNYRRVRKPSLKKGRDRRAVSPIIATILIVSLITTALAIGIVFIVPYAQRTQGEAILSQAINAMQEIDEAIYKCAFLDNPEDPKGQQLVTVELSGGKLEIVSLGESEELYLEIDGVSQIPFVENYGKSFLRYSFTSGHSLIEPDINRYLMGTNPYIQRDEVITDRTEDKRMTNMTLTRKSGSDSHNIYLSYRCRLFVEEGLELTLKLITIEIINGLSGPISGDDVTLVVELQDRQDLSPSSYGFGYDISLYGIFSGIVPTSYIHHSENFIGFSDIHVTVLNYRVKISEYQ